MFLYHFTVSFAFTLSLTLKASMLKNLCLLVSLFNLINPKYFLIETKEKMKKLMRVLTIREGTTI